MVTLSQCGRHKLRLGPGGVGVGVGARVNTTAPELPEHTQGKHKHPQKEAAAWQCSPAW